MEKKAVFFNICKSLETAHVSLVFHGDSRAAFVFPMPTSVFSVFDIEENFTKKKIFSKPDYVRIKNFIGK